MITLIILAATTDDVAASHYNYRLLEVFDQTILPWSSFGAILSGIAVSLTTKWGIIKELLGFHEAHTRSCGDYLRILIHTQLGSDRRNRVRPARKLGR